MSSAKVGLLLLLLFSCLIVCNSQGNNESGTEAPTETKSKDTLSEYFRHEPYGPGTYAFGFEIHDIDTENRQFRDERQYSNGTVEGSYGYVRPDGRITITHFIADGIHGYLSQTNTFQQGDMDTDQENWRRYFYQVDQENQQDQHTTTTDKMESKVEPSTAPDHIDLEKDLLNPTLSEIIKGNLLSENNGTTKQPELKTFQNVIPDQFPIVPFELPQKVLENLEPSDKKMSLELHNKMGSKTTDENTMKNVERNESTEEKIEHEPPSEQGDWISSFVNQTRKEFLENVPSSL